MRSSHFDADSRAAVHTLMRVVDNVLGRPGDPATRALRLGNAAFRRRVGSVTGGVQFLLACGFELLDDGVVGDGVVGDGVVSDGVAGNGVVSDGVVGDVWWAMAW